MKKRTWVPALLALSVLLLAAISAAAQEVTRVSREAPAMTYNRDFTNLRSLRELPDGGIIVIEGQGGEVVLLAPDGQGERIVGNQGQGPNEYLSPTRVVPLAGSPLSLLIDPVGQRLLVLDGSARVLVSEPWRFPPGIVPAARDASEGMYYDDENRVTTDSNGQVREGDAHLFRFRRGHDLETMATLKVYDLAERYGASAVSSMFRPGPGGFANFNLSKSAFGAQDLWQLMADGRVAIARVSPYRIEFVETDGGLTSGPEVAYDPIPVEEADKEAWMAALSRGASGGQMSFSGEDGRTIPIRPPTPDLESLYFPENKPPFTFGSMFVSPDGEVWVQRTTAANAEQSLVDVFDRQGNRVGQVELPPDRVLVGVGQGALYAIHYNEFDVQALERYQR